MPRKYSSPTRLVRWLSFLGRRFFIRRFLTFCFGPYLRRTSGHSIYASKILFPNPISSVAEFSGPAFFYPAFSYVLFWAVPAKDFRPLDLCLENTLPQPD